MKYTYFDIPGQFVGSISHFDRKRAREYFKWFISVKDERLKILERAVQTTKNFESWEADFSVFSLTPLQKWFESVVEKRSTTEREKETQKKIYTGTKFEQYFKETGPTQWTLSEITESICHDVGIYFAEVLIKNNQGLKWGQDVRTKTSINRHYPVVQGFVGADFNPQMALRNFALNYLGDKKLNWSEIYKSIVQHIKKNQK